MIKKFYSRKEIANELNLSQSRLSEIINLSGIDCYSKKANIFYYTVNQIAEIKDYYFQMIIKPMKISEQYLIIHSKINFDE